MPKLRPMSALLVTGFEPFLTHDRNPSALLAQTLDGQSIGGHPVAGLTLPVTYAGAAPRLQQAIEAMRPAAVVMFGLAYETDCIRPERLALNLDDATAADNDGESRRNRPIDPAGPLGYWSSLPLDRLADRLGRAGFPVKISRDAGGYLCNHLFFRTRHWLEERGRPIPAGFVHLPPLPDGIRPEDRGHRSGMDLDRQLTAARLVLETLAERAEV